jgi:hypothetical protein
MKNFRFILTAFAFCGIFNMGIAQDVKLHVSPRWKECSFQLDPSLTQKAWHQFTREAGLVSYFRPLKDAQPMGAKNFEFSIVQWNTAFNDKAEAWNNTFVHIDSTHYLKEGSRLPFPGLTFRAGITDKLDVGIYWTKSVGANYGFWGGQVQYNLVNNEEKKWAASARASIVSIYGPKDLKLAVYGLDFIVSKEVPVYSDKISISPYVGVSTYLSNSYEKSSEVNLRNEHVGGGQAMIGTVAKVSFARVGVEYSFAKVSTFSFKIGVALNSKKRTNTI